MQFLAVCALTVSCLIWVPKLPVQELHVPAKQDVDKLSLEELIEVRVTVTVASLFDENELILGSTVERIGHVQWQRRGARTFSTAIGASPGVMVVPNTFGSDIVAIRGYLGAAPGRGVNMRLDGAPINDFTFGSAQSDIFSLRIGALDRIEMIRGPGSTLYGADAFHGVLSLQTFESDKDVLELDGETGTDFYRSGAIRMSRDVGDGWRLETALAYSGQPGQDVPYEFSGPTPGRSEYENRYDAMMGVIKLRSDPKEGFSGRVGLYAKGQVQKEFQGMGRLFSSSMGPRNLSDNESQFGMANGGLTFRFEDTLSLDLAAFGWHLESDRRADRTNVSQPPLVFEGNEARAGASAIIKQSGNAWKTQWAAGYEFGHQEILDAPDSAAPGGKAPYDGDVRRVHSVFFQARTSFFDDTLHVLYGARYDGYSDADDPISPRGGLICQPTADTAVKVLYGHAFRPTSAIEARGSPPTVGAASGEPETIDTWELAFMKQAPRWRASVTLFRSDWKDALLPVSNPSPPPSVLRENIGENRTHGVEVSITWIEDVFRVDASTSWLESEDRTSDVDYAGFPRWIINAGGGYSHTAWNLDFYLNNRIHLGAEEGPVTGRVPDPEDLEDYWRTDLTVTWRNAKKYLEVYLAFLNLFDRENFFPTATGAEGGIPDIDFTASLGLHCSF